MQEVKPPWVTYPGYPPQDIFWRQPGEAWAVHVWLPYWTSLNAEQKSLLLDKWNAPSEWREYYSPEFQAWLAELDGPAGFILRNNLCLQSEAAAHNDAVRLETQKRPPSILSKAVALLRALFMVFGGAMAIAGFVLMLKNQGCLPFR